MPACRYRAGEETMGLYRDCRRTGKRITAAGLAYRVVGYPVDLIIVGEDPRIR